MEGGQPHFLPDGEILFRHNEGASTADGSLGFIYRVRPDGTGLRKAVEQPVNQFNFSSPVSPDGRWVFGWAPLGGTRTCGRPGVFARRKDADLARRPWTSHLGRWGSLVVDNRVAAGFLRSAGGGPDFTADSGGRISFRRRNRPPARRDVESRAAWSLSVPRPMSTRSIAATHSGICTAFRFRDLACVKRNFTHLKLRQRRPSLSAPASAPDRPVRNSIDHADRG